MYLRCRIECCVAVLALLAGCGAKPARSRPARAAPSAAAAP